MFLPLAATNSWNLKLSSLHSYQPAHIKALIIISVSESSLVLAIYRDTFQCSLNILSSLKTCLYFSRLRQE